jgi:transcriptional regulator of acetoin/glycerol metabolism
LIYGLCGVASDLSDLADQEPTMQRPGHPALASPRALRLRLADGVPPDARDAVAPAVLRSWERTQRAGLRPADRALFAPAPSTLACRRLEEEHRVLIDCATTDMQRLRRSLGSSNWVVLLANAHGTVVGSVGHELAAARELREPLRIGKDLREEFLGTNAPACVLTEGVSTTVIGAEHYLDELQHYACAAAPIHGPAGDIVGVLDATGWQVRPESDLLRRVSLSARSIENRLLHALPGVAILQLHHDERLLGTPLEGLLAVDGAGRLVALNAMAARLLKRPGPLPSGLALPDLLPDDATALWAVQPGAAPPRNCVGAAPGTGLFARWAGAPSHTKTAAARAPLPPALPPLDGDPSLEASLERAIRVVQHGLPVLVQGETGVGKEVFARHLHHHARGEAPFIAVNCSALPEGLIESELFGYVDGAFTGARRGGATGKLAQAHGGTLFLDEIGDMPLGLQTRLLRVLQERSFVPIGGHRSVPIDLLVVAATHRDVRAMVKAGEFREDLYYRLAGYVVHLPALRERGNLRGLIERELQRIDPEAQLADETWQRLLAQRWPGNLRQLVQTLRAAVALCDDPWRVVHPRDLPELLEASPNESAADASDASEGGSLTDVKRRAIEVALERHHGNVSAVARELKLSRTTVYALRQR